MRAASCVTFTYNECEETLSTTTTMQNVYTWKTSGIKSWNFFFVLLVFCVHLKVTRSLKINILHKIARTHTFCHLLMWTRVKERKREWQRDRKRVNVKNAYAFSQRRFDFGSENIDRFTFSIIQCLNSATWRKIISYAARDNCLILSLTHTWCVRYTFCCRLGFFFMRTLHLFALGCTLWPTHTVNLAIKTNSSCKTITLIVYLVVALTDYKCTKYTY